MPTGNNRQDGWTEQEQVQLQEWEQEQEQEWKNKQEPEIDIHERLAVLEEVTMLEKEVEKSFTQSKKERIDEVPNEPKEANLKSFTSGLESLINLYSMENWCDVPDFILAEMITDFIVTTGKSIKKTLTWHGTDSICHNTQVATEEEYIEGYKKWQKERNSNE